MAKVFAFTGPNVAISCEVEWDSRLKGYLATSDAGWTGLSRDTASQAALECFKGWLTGQPADGRVYAPGRSPV